MSKRNKAVFLDKDGTLVEDVPYNVDPEKIRLYDQVPEALLVWKRQGYKLVIVTNQSGVAHGYFPEKEILVVERTIRKILREHDIELDGFYYCPHHVNGKVPEYAINCSCRKPKPGMILSAARDLKIDLSASWMIGDILNDVEAGNAAGCNTILINNGNETEWKNGPLRKPAYIATGMAEAVRITGHKEGVAN